MSVTFLGAGSQIFEIRALLLAPDLARILLGPSHESRQHIYTPYRIDQGSIEAENMSEE
jgi:hypothetical protein